MLSILPTSDLSLSLLPQLMKRRQTLRTRLERLYLKKTGQASSSLLFYSTQWMEIRIRNHSGLNGRASALAPTPVICLPVSSGHFYLIFKAWDHDNELSLTFTVDYFHRHSARADHYFETHQVSRCSVSESNIIMWPFAMPTQIDGWWAPRR